LRQVGTTFAYVGSMVISVQNGILTKGGSVQRSSNHQLVSSEQYQALSIYDLRLMMVNF
jgi:hypothetical protein